MIVYLSIVCIGCLAIAALVIIEFIVTENPETKLSKWWRKHIVSDTHKEE